MQFDRLTRTLATRGDRRGMLTRFAAGVFIGVGTVLGLKRANAQGQDACQAPGRKCSDARQCCSGGRCRRGRCRCPRGLVACRGECRKPAGAACTNYGECCSQSCDFLVGGGTCSPCQGHYCQSDRDCCGGLPCHNNRCGGCLGRGIVCGEGDACCFSSCDGGVCLSDFGNPCAHDADCWGCYMNGLCSGACVDGACTV
jgi:hypothetical protein